MRYELRNAVEVRQEMEHKWLDMTGEMTDNEISTFKRRQSQIAEFIADAAEKGKYKIYDVIEYRFYRKMCEHLRTLGYTVHPSFEHRKIINLFKTREQWDFDLKTTYDGNIAYTVEW